MKQKLKVLIASRSRARVIELAKRLEQRDTVDLELRHIVNGHADPLADAATTPDILVLHMAGGAGGELEALLGYPTAARPPLVVVSETDDPALMRLAMKAGARDFLTAAPADEVLSSIDAISEEVSAEAAPAGRTVAVINAKGGSGATFIACNLAHLAARRDDAATALIGLDLQFPTLPAYFDMKLRHGLVQALESVDELDSVALEAIMAKHDSGLKLLAARPEEFRLSFDSYADRIKKLFDLLQTDCRNLFVDVPRHIDEVSAQVLSRASNIVIVVQQSLPHVQDATRLLQLLRDQLGISPDRVTVVVNRFGKNADVQIDDIRAALPGTSVKTLPNGYREVSESINVGVPIYDSARQSPVTRALVKLQSGLLTGHGEEQPGAGRISSLLQRGPLQSIFGGH